MNTIKNIAFFLGLALFFGQSTAMETGSTGETKKGKKETLKAPTRLFWVEFVNNTKNTIILSEKILSEKDQKTKKLVKIKDLAPGKKFQMILKEKPKSWQKYLQKIVITDKDNKFYVAKVSAEDRSTSKGDAFDVFASFETKGRFYGRKWIPVNLDTHKWKETVIIQKDEPVTYTLSFNIKGDKFNETLIDLFIATESEVKMKSTNNKK